MASNIRYDRRLGALAIRSGKREALDYDLFDRLSRIEDPCLLPLRCEEPGAPGADIYYPVVGTVGLGESLARPISRSQYLALLESMLDVMTLCVREGLPQGKVCFAPELVRVDERGRLRFACVPLARVTWSSLELLGFLGDPRHVRMVLPEDDAVRLEVEGFSRRCGPLSVVDLDSFLSSLGPRAACGPRADGPVAAPPPVRGTVGDAGVLGTRMTFDPVAAMAGSAPARPLARGVASEVRARPDAGAFAPVAATSLLGSALASPPPALLLERLRDGSRIVLPARPVLLGRSRICDVTLSGNGAISRKHAQFDPAAMSLVDLGSANGTFVHGVRLASGSAVAVGLGEEFVLADEAFRLVEP